MTSIFFLFIKSGRVVFQFHYNVLVIDGIKAHIEGRRWEPLIGGKGCWTCPLSSLPHAVAFYKHMGRQPDQAIEMSDNITIKVQLQNPDLLNCTIGFFLVIFAYDPLIFAVMKKWNHGLPRMIGLRKSGRGSWICLHCRRYWSA